MAKKNFLLAMGERNVNPVDTDELLKSKINERKRKEVERQEEIDEQQHKARMAELRKKETAAEASTAKVGEKKEDTGGFKVEGSVKLGTIDIQASMQKQIDERDALRKEAQQLAANQQQISDDLRERLHGSEMQVLKTSFDAQMQVLTKMIETSASKGSFMEQYQSMIEMAKTLGFSQPQMAGDLSTQMEMKKMEFYQVMELKKAAREEKRADREFQRQLNRDAEEREASKREQAQQDKRDDMFAQAPKVVGRVIAEGLIKRQESGGRVAQEAPPEAEAPMEKGARHIEAGWGDIGEVECPGCSEPLAIGPTATVAVCANCAQSVPIRRVGEKSVARKAPPNSQTISQTTSQTSAPQAAKAPKRKQQAYIETGWGESGTVECPLCSQPIPINQSAFEVVCANCNQKIEVKRSGQRPTFPLDEGA